MNKFSKKCKHLWNSLIESNVLVYVWGTIMIATITAVLLLIFAAVVLGIVGLVSLIGVIV